MSVDVSTDTCAFIRYVYFVHVIARPDATVSMEKICVWVGSHVISSAGLNIIIHCLSCGRHARRSVIFNSIMELSVNNGTRYCKHVIVITRHDIVIGMRLMDSADSLDSFDDADRGAATGPM